jgi:predicted nucleic acid-binding protein
VLVAAMIEAHPAHAQALPWLHRMKARADTGLVAAHSLAELYAVLTTLPLQPRIPPTMAQELIKRNVLDILEVVPLSDEDYVAVIDHLSRLGIVGGATYDALILYSASKAYVDRVGDTQRKGLLQSISRAHRKDRRPIRIHIGLNKPTLLSLESVIPDCPSCTGPGPSRIQAI